MREVIADNLARVRQQIADAAQAAGRGVASIRLIAVSKHQPPEAVDAAFAAGQRDFGENYVQELVEKTGAGTWHFIGHLQRNKINALLPHVHWIHGIDSPALAQAIAQRATAPINGLIQINLDDETSKAGIAPDQLIPLLTACAALPQLRLHGLMAIPRPRDDPNAMRPAFAQLRLLLASANRAACYPHPLTELSMGMSADFPAAIAEGATMLRIGTAIFGERAKA